MISSDSAWRLPVQMSLIFSAGSLVDVHPPCVLQSFVNHGAVLHKVFVVGDRHFCVERPSLKNFPSGPCGWFTTPLAVICGLFFSNLSAAALWCSCFFGSSCFDFSFLHAFPFCLQFTVSVSSSLPIIAVVIFLPIQRERQSSSTANRCPNQSPAVISHL